MHVILIKHLARRHELVQVDQRVGLSRPDLAQHSVVLAERMPNSLQRESVMIVDQRVSRPHRRAPIAVFVQAASAGRQHHAHLVNSKHTDH
jgi:hypothetical protein